MIPPTPSPLDGLTAPLQAPSPSDPLSQQGPSSDLPQKPTSHLLSLGTFSLAILYVLGGLFLLILLPSTNDALALLPPVGTFVYGLGLMVWGALAFLSFYRILTYKNTSVGVRRMAGLRAIVMEVPALLISMLVLLLINREPQLSIDLLAPKTTDPLSAPVSITFGTESATKYLRKNNMTPISFSWDFEGDGKVNQETSEPQITALYSKGGTYRVSASVRLTNGQSRTLRRTVQIPRTLFAVDPENPVIDETASFSLDNLYTDPKKEFLKAEWDFDGDGITDVATDKTAATYTFHRLGPVEPTVKVTNVSNAVLTIKRPLTVVEPPKLPFPVSLRTEPTTLLSPAPFGVLFSVETDVPVANVTWDFGDGENAEGPKAAHNFERTGVFPVVAAVRSQSGSIAKITKRVTVTDTLQIADLSFSGTPEVRGNRIEKELPLELNITPQTTTPLITFTWDAPGASEVLSTDKVLRAIYRKEGDYVIELIGIDPSQKVMRRRIDIHVLPPKSEVSIDVQPTTPVAPAVVSFDATSTFIPGKEITGYEWDFGDSGGTQLLGAQTDHTYSKPGTYQIHLRVKTLDGAVYEGSKTLVVRVPIQEACFLPSRTSGSAPLPVSFDTSCSSSGSFTSWLWDFGDGSQSDEANPIHTFTAPGEYTVLLKATGKDGKTVERRATITVQ